MDILKYDVMVRSWGCIGSTLAIKKGDYYQITNHMECKQPESTLGGVVNVLLLSTSRPFLSKIDVCWLC